MESRKCFVLSFAQIGMVFKKIKQADRFVKKNVRLGVMYYVIGWLTDFPDHKGTNDIFF